MGEPGTKGNNPAGGRRSRACSLAFAAIALIACNCAQADTIAEFNLNSNPGWAMDTGWAFGAPTGGGGQHGSPDPASGHTGPNVYGYNLSGDYPNSIPSRRSLTTTAIDCSHYSNVHLNFWRWLGVEGYDFAAILVSNNGSTWTNVWLNSGATIADSAWTNLDYDISAVASGQATVYVRWGLGPTDSVWQYCGWNIDDVIITGDPVPPFVETYRFERMWPQLPQPWYFSSPEGVAMNSEGHIFVADTVNRRILKFDASGRYLATIGAAGPGDGQFNNPYDVAVDDSDNLYVADTANDRIQKFDANGSFVSKWGALGSGIGQFNGPIGIAAGTGGRIYVVEWDNSRVQAFDTNGQYLFTWGSQGSGPGQFDNPSGIAVDELGQVYVADTGNNRIQKLDSDGTCLAAWGSLGAGDGAFSRPRGVAVAAGYVYVADSNNHRIQKFTSNGVFVTKWGSWGSSDQQLQYPRGIALDKAGNLHVADSYNNRIITFESNGTLVAQWSPLGSEAGQFNRPIGIVSDSSGQVYVADSENHRIQKFDQHGAFLTSWGSFGQGEGQFNYPSGLAVDAAGNTFISDGGRIQKFNSINAFVTQWGTAGSGDGQFADPRSVAVDASGNVYVADFYNNRIQKFQWNTSTLQYQFVAKWGEFGDGDGLFFGPNGIVLGPGGNLYVSDYGNHRIQSFDPDGVFISKWGSGSWGQGDGEFQLPAGLAVGPTGNIFEADFGNNRVQVFDSEMVFKTKLGGGGTAPGKFRNPSGVACGLNGSVYVSETENHRVQKFRPVTLFSYDKAVVVAGRKSADDILWPATQKVTIDAIKALNFRGIAKDQIRYLSHNTQLDVDGNFLPDDVAGLPSAANVQNALTTWAVAPFNGLPIENVVVYLADHGGPTHYYLDEDTTLDAATLNGWLNTLEAGIDGRLTVVLEACYSGSFLSTLKKAGRTVIASTLPTEEAYFIDNGVASFSGFFWQQVLFGRDLGTCFTSAQSSVNIGGLPQHPQVDVDGDGTANEAVGDLDALAAMHIGSNIEYATAFPVITSVAITGLSGSTATLTATGVTDADGSVARVFAKIQPPGFGTTDFEGNPILGLPEVTLDLVPSTSNYSIAYNGFTKQGTYNVTFYAMDNFLYLGEPKAATITVGAPNHRRAVLVAGGSLAHEQWDAYARSYGRAYEALKKQLYDDNDIMIFAHSNVVSTTEPVTVPTLQGLTGTGAGTLRSWVGTNTQDLTIYLVGPGADDLFQLNDDDYLSSAAFSALCATLQASLSVGGTLTVILDACSAGSFADNLIGANRMIVTSTNEGESARFIEQDTGIVSFSEYFWTRTGKGDTVELAYLKAKESMASHDQTPGLDDNGDGLLSQVSDGSKARYYRIGHGIILGADEPVVREAIEFQQLSGGTSATLWADGVFSPGRTVTSVWASIAPPGYGDSGDACQALLTRVPLSAGASHDYEAVYDKFRKLGDYQIKVYCTDNRGNTSQAKSGIVRQTVNVADTVKPSITGFLPANNAIGVAPLPVIRFTASDTGSGVDINGITLSVNGLEVSDELSILGTPGSYTVRYSPQAAFLPGASVYVVLSAADLQGNVQGPLAYHFTVTNGVDSNSDGLPDDWAAYYGITNPAGNNDGDQFTNLEEALWGTDPGMADAVPTGPDDYENDDASTTAAWAGINDPKQMRNFHDRGDVDWVQFYASQTTVLSFYTLDLGSDADTTLALYASGNLSTPLATDTNPGELAAVILNWTAPADGYYYVKIRNSNANQWLYGANAYYAFKIAKISGGWEITAVITPPRLSGAVGDLQELDGLRSSDGVAIPASWNWSVVEYPTATMPVLTITNSGTPPRPATARFTPSQAGEYVVRLIVGDGAGHYGEARANVTVTASTEVIWVDFDAQGFPATAAEGTPSKPFLDLWRAEDRVSDDGVISINPGDTGEILSFGEQGKAMHLSTAGGLVRIGKDLVKKTPAPPAPIPSPPSTASIPSTPSIPSIPSIPSTTTTDDHNPLRHDQTTYEPMIPYTQPVPADSPLAIRLRCEAEINPETLLASGCGQSETDRPEWQPAGADGDLRDLWVLCTPEDTWHPDDLITLSVSGATDDGAPVTSEVYEFQIESEEDYTARAEAPEAILPPPVPSEPQEAALAEFSGNSSVGSVGSDGSNLIALPNGYGAARAIVPEQVYATPQRIWLPLPEGLSPEDVQLYYYHANGDDYGWYPAENVEGWLVPGSYLHLRQDGETYLGFLVNHAGIVQLGNAQP